MSSQGRVVMGILLGVLASGGCGKESPPPAGSENTGSVALALQLGGGVKLSTAAWTITGPNAFTRMGTIDVRNSTTLSATIGNLPAGAGYGIVITATASDGVTVCQGSASFTVVVGVTRVMVHLRCLEPPRTGTVQVRGTLNVCPVIDGLSASPDEALVGGTIALEAAAHDTDGAPSPVAYLWTTTAGTLLGATTRTPSFTCTAAGPATVSLAVSDGDCGDMRSLVVTCTAPPPAEVRINEIESNGGVPGDWVELVNRGGTTADVSGWVFKDNDDTHVHTLPAGSTIPPGGYLLIEEAALGFGLGTADSARLYDAGGALVDSYAWTAHANPTYARCPNATGELRQPGSTTKGAANDCGMAPPDTTPPGDPWPGANNVVTVDAENAFTVNLSGLDYEAGAGGQPSVLWAVVNAPATLHKLVFDGTIWKPATADDWGAGKALRYPGDAGNPDSESVTLAEIGSSAIYVAAERDNAANNLSRLSVLRYDTAAAGATLVATHEWNMTADLPAVGPNLGFEAITWIPDAHLVARGFFDERLNQTYDPASYANHGAGLFLLGVEANGLLHAYALDHVAGTFQRVATVASGHPGIMGVEFDRETGNLWAACDDSCAGRTNVLAIDTTAGSPTRGRFVIRRRLARASTMPNINNEGLGIVPESECVSGMKSIFWADDGNTGGHALRRDLIPCGAF